MGAATVTTLEWTVQADLPPELPLWKPALERMWRCVIFQKKWQHVKSSLTVQRRSKRKNSTKSGLQRGVHSAACEDGTQTHVRGSQLQHSHLQDRKKLKEHSWGRSILVGNKSSFCTSYFKTRNQKFSERRGKSDKWVCSTAEEKSAARCQLLFPFPTHFKCTTSSTNTEQTATGTATETHRGRIQETWILGEKRQNQNRRPNPSSPAVILLSFTHIILLM